MIYLIIFILAALSWFYNLTMFVFFNYEPDDSLIIISFGISLLFFTAMAAFKFLDLIEKKKKRSREL